MCSSFNAEDEMKLIKLFQAIQNERNFHKKYRQISNDLIEEIDKPNRRFRVKIEDLFVTEIQEK